MSGNQAASLTGIQHLKTAPTSFFDLPAEVRNQVYELTLQNGESFRPLGNQHRPAFSALLAAHPRIRSEAETMKWFSGAFVFELSKHDIHSNAPEASRWLVNLGRIGVRNLGSLTISHEDRFSLTLGSAVVGGRRTLVIKDLNMATPDLTRHPSDYYTAYTRKSIDNILEIMYLDENLDLGSYCEHNLIGGLAQFLYHCDRRFRWGEDSWATAPEFVMGVARYRELFDYSGTGHYRGFQLVRRCHNESNAEQVCLLDYSGTRHYRGFQLVRCCDDGSGEKQVCSRA